MRRLLPLLALFLALLAPAAEAASSAPVVTRHATASLISATDHITPGQPLLVGLYLRLEPGWHIYWQNPGDAGSPPELHFTLPAGASAGPILWPAPEREHEATLVTFGYSGAVLLAVQISHPASPITLHASWLICNQVCVPEEGNFTLSLSPGPPTPSAEAPLFAAAAAARPQPSPWRAVIDAQGRLAVLGEGVATAAGKEAFFLPLAADRVEAAAPQPMQLSDDRLVLTLHPGPAFKPGKPLAGVLETVAADGVRHAYALTAEPGHVALPKPAQEAAEIGWLFALALLGGLLLNVMPCVFPVLAVKAAGLAATARAPARTRITHALAYALGVVLSFAAIGAALLVLQEAGASVGWGFQFQSPVFVVIVTWVLFAVGLNLSGVFALNWGGGIGDSLASRADLWGSFFAGLLAVIVASPCTAPFMGAAIGTALAANALAAMTVFLGLGLGLASPYVLLAVVPYFARLLPRPGAWMELLRQVLAFPMYGAGVWLLWVISEEAGSAGVLASGTGLALIGFAAWVLGYRQRRHDLGARGRRIAETAAVAALLLAIAVLPPLAQLPMASGTMPPAAGYQTFSDAKLEALRAEGRPVLVDISAAWCITCLVNERLVLDRPEVRQALAAHHVVLLRGDWTREDPAITRFLRAHGRDGVPLYLFYAPKQPPVELPQILTEGAVLHLVDALPR